MSQKCIERQCRWDRSGFGKFVNCRYGDGSTMVNNQCTGYDCGAAEDYGEANARVELASD